MLISEMSKKTNITLSKMVSHFLYVFLIIKYAIKRVPNTINILSIIAIIFVPIIHLVLSYLDTYYLFFSSIITLTVFVADLYILVSAAVNVVSLVPYIFVAAVASVGVAGLFNVYCAYSEIGRAHV